MTYSDLYLLLSGLVVFLLGGGLGFWICNQFKKSALRQVQEEAEERAMRQLAEEERSQRLELLEEKDNWYKTKAQQERELEEQLGELNKREKVLVNKDRELNSQREDVRKEWSRLKNQERRLRGREKGLQEKEEELEKSLENYRQRLELVGNLTSEEAREQLMEHLAGEVKARAAAMIRTERTRAREEADRQAQKIISQAIQRCAVEEVVQMTTSTVTLPNEGIKSRIIGKEGRNVRTFETVTGVKVVVDDTPDTVLLSSYDPARREVAVKAMKQLIM